MRVATILASLALLSVVALTSSAADEKKADRRAPEKSPGLEKFKQLAGEWVGKEVSGLNPGQEVRVIYKVTSAGSAVVETLLPGGEHEMVTVIHADGDDLALTHYCALGNQPHMKTKGKIDGDKFAFKFVGASNLKSEKEMHMHDVTYTFIDLDTLKTEWTHYDDGKPAGTVVFELKRKK
jgi:hypothetical protein